MKTQNGLDYISFLTLMKSVQLLFRIFFRLYIGGDAIAFASYEKKSVFLENEF